MRPSVGAERGAELSGTFAAFVFFFAWTSLTSGMAGVSHHRQGSFPLCPRKYINYLYMSDLVRKLLTSKPLTLAIAGMSPLAKTRCPRSWKRVIEPSTQRLAEIPSTARHRRSSIKGHKNVLILTVLSLISLDVPISIP